MNTSPRLSARRAAGPLTRLRLVWRDAAALLLALRDPRTNQQSRLIAAAALLYAISPIDLLPDGVPLLGLSDDLLLVPAVLAFAARSLPAPVLQDARGRLNSWQRLTPLAKPKLLVAVAIMVVLGAAVLCAGALGAGTLGWTIFHH